LHILVYFGRKINNFFIYRWANMWENGLIGNLAVKCPFHIQNSIQSKYKYDIRNQRVKLHINDMLLRMFYKNFFRSLGGPQGGQNVTRKWCETKW
jgi:hypothetical protein